MIKAILFDLDDTLLHNSAMVFVRAYLQLLSDYLAQRLPRLKKDDLFNALIFGTQQTIMNCDPLRLNIAVFYEHFTHKIEIDAAELDVAVQDFYREKYPDLQALTRPVEAAPGLVRWLFEHDYKVAIATHPLFQTSPIEQRLGWAEMPPEDWPFECITSMDNMHFTKPHPHFYEELLTKIGVEPDEALMVGDDWENDIVAAQRAGLNTFWIVPSDTTDVAINPSPDIVPDEQGTVEHLARLITEQGWLDTLQPHPLMAEQIIPRMNGNLAALLGMVEDTPESFWNMRPDPQEWSPLEVVVHLRESERNVQRPRLERILQEENPFLLPPPTPPAPGEQALAGEDGRRAMSEFAEERLKTLQLLESLAVESWMRPARHSIFGPTSFLEMAAFTARHDRLHITQFKQTVEKCK